MRYHINISAAREGKEGFLSALQDLQYQIQNAGDRFPTQPGSAESYSGAYVDADVQANYFANLPAKP